MPLCQRTARTASAKFKIIFYKQEAYCCSVAQQANWKPIPWAKSEPVRLISNSESKHRREVICFRLGFADGKTDMLHLDVYFTYLSFYLWKVMESEQPVSELLAKLGFKFVCILSKFWNMGFSMFLFPFSLLWFILWNFSACAVKSYTRKWFLCMLSVLTFCFLFCMLTTVNAQCENKQSSSKGSLPFPSTV